MGGRNIQHFSNNLPKYWIRNYLKNLNTIDTLSGFKSEKSDTLEILKHNYNKLSKASKKFKVIKKRYDEIEQRLIKEFKTLSSNELMDLRKEYDTLKLKINKFNNLKKNFDENYTKLMKKYDNPPNNKSIINKNLLIAKAERNNYSNEFKKLLFIIDVAKIVDLFLDTKKEIEEEPTNTPDKCSITDNNKDLCLESKAYENLDFNKVDEGEQKILFGKLGLNDNILEQSQPVSKCESKYLSSFDDSYL